MAVVIYGDEIRYTLDGITEPSSTTSLYSGPFNLIKNTVVKAKALKTGWTNSDTAQITITILVANPTITPAIPGTYLTKKEVTMSCSSTSSIVRYTTNGSDPTITSSTLYTEGYPLVLDRTRTVKVRGFKTDCKESNIVSVTITIKIEKPEFMPTMSGTFINYIDNVKMQSNTPSAVIWYTTNLDTPTNAAPSLQYTIPLNVT